jgi:hypothetical protein
MLGLGCLKVSGLSLVPAPPHMIHAFIFFPDVLYEYISNDFVFVISKVIDDGYSANEDHSANDD